MGAAIQAGIIGGDVTSDIDLSDIEINLSDKNKEK